MFQHAIVCIHYRNGVHNGGIRWRTNGNEGITCSCAPVEGRGSAYAEGSTFSHTKGIVAGEVYIRNIYCNGDLVCGSLANLVGNRNRIGGSLAWESDWIHNGIVIQASGRAPGEAHRIHTTRWIGQELRCVTQTDCRRTLCHSIYIERGGGGQEGPGLHIDGIAIGVERSYTPVNIGVFSR